MAVTKQELFRHAKPCYPTDRELVLAYALGEVAILPNAYLYNLLDGFIAFGFYTGGFFFEIEL